MTTPKGHSNAQADQAAPYPTNTEKARIPIEGGASPYKVKALPPLALSREEWATIGRNMKWDNDAEYAEAVSKGVFGPDRPVTVTDGKLVCPYCQSEEIQHIDDVTESRDVIKVDATKRVITMDGLAKVDYESSRADRFECRGCMAQLSVPKDFSLDYE